MKNIVVVLLLLAGTVVHAQTNVRFNINHKLGDQNFAFNSASKNNLNDAFKLSRLEYYISKISIIHDGGKETKADAYLLVDAGASTDESIGSFNNIDSVEAIKFSVGVDPFENNSDPSKWPASHPLSPKSPSMHWGWQAGYRFVAMEGKAGDNLTTNFEFHALGNQNYFDISIPTAATKDGNDLVISLNADYTEAIRNIAVSKGLIVHGDYDEAAYVLRNFQLYVFSSTTGETNTLSAPSLNQALLGMYPNPTTSDVTIDLSAAGVSSGEVIVRNLLGQEVIRRSMTTSQTTIEVNQPGAYMVDVLTSAGRLTKKLVVQ
ncbi:MAG: T9SS type A sorting domain-containing protein [Flavobacteriales bacterium]|nr:T9SS type A sorting domain-containing protein [Bacteroidota bacterium]MCB9241200.1 T9SS type A sorting domain-containing protein [Flavobacteriales bacterium]